MLTKHVSIIVNISLVNPVGSHRLLGVTVKKYGSGSHISLLP